MRNEKINKLYAELATPKKNKETLLEKGALFRSVPFLIVYLGSIGFFMLVFGFQAFANNLVEVSKVWFMLGFVFVVAGEFIWIYYIIYDEIKRKKFELLSMYKQVKKKESDLKVLEED